MSILSFIDPSEKLTFALRQVQLNIEPLVHPSEHSNTLLTSANVFVRSASTPLPEDSGALSELSVLLLSADDGSALSTVLDELSDEVEVLSDEV